MNNLETIKVNGKFYVGSRQVAEMVDKQHAHLMRDIKGYCAILTESNFGLSEFFLESTYKDSTGRTLPCYLITKKGCDMVANKMTGEKGILFTAAYVNTFEGIEVQLQAPTALPTNYLDALKALVVSEEAKQLAVSSNNGFSLLTMGFTGSKAMAWKLEYIKAFNDMEAAIKNESNVLIPNFNSPAETARTWANEFEAKQIK